MVFCGVMLLLCMLKRQKSLAWMRFVGCASRGRSAHSCIIKRILTWGMGTFVVEGTQALQQLPVILIKQDQILCTE